MLVDLKVKNFVIIDEMEISFEKGLNVLTGETGAGKSIIIGALDMLLGSRASSDVVRSGAEKSYIEAVYRPEKLELVNDILQQAGIEPDEDIVLLSREIRLNGRNRSRINGQLATLSMVRKISRYLVDIHGQHEHQLLLNRGEHLQLLDDFIGDQASDLRREMEEKFSEMHKLAEKIAELQLDEGEEARQLDMLNYQIREIEEAHLQSDELPELKREYKVLSNMEEIYSVTGEIAQDFNGEDYNQPGVLDRLGEFMSRLEEIKEYDPGLDEIFQNIQDAFYSLQEAGFDLQNYHQDLEFNEDRLQEIEDRLDLIQTLQKKYGSTIDEILSYKEEMVKKRDKLSRREQLISEYKEKRSKREQEYYRLAEKISNIRKERARQLEKNLKGEFADLALGEAEFKVDFSRKEPAADGIDRIQFLITTNPGEELKPLAQVASGGELSRIMLALKTVIADIDKVETLIFDEVDSGVGGKTAQKMAEKLAHLGQKRQILCITHLPQIASMSDTHFFISKKAEEDVVQAEIKKLGREERRDELARMLGGVKTTETTREHAEEMLTMAEEKK